MSERVTRFAAPILLLAALAVGVLVPTDLGIGDPDSEAADGLRTLLSGLDDGAGVLVGFDPDIGTYAEVRPTVRTLLAELVDHGTSVSIVSLTPEGRALALAELGRAARLAPDAPEIADLGFVPGAEAALVTVAGAIAGSSDLRTSGGTAALDATDLIVVVGGNDLGPRSWVEQVLPRIDPTPMIAITPVSLLPEVEPYRQSGQLAAVIATPRDGASYRSMADPGTFAGLAEVDGGPPALSILLGLLAAIAWLGEIVVRRLGPALAARPERERS